MRWKSILINTFCRCAFVTLFVVTVSACVSIGGADKPTDRRYELLASPVGCNSDAESPPIAIHFGIIRADSAVSSDRISQRLIDTGEVRVLAGARWVSNAPRMLEDQIVRDLIDAQYPVQTANQRYPQQRSLKCELRDLSLHRSQRQDTAKLALACSLEQSTGERHFNISKSTPLERWSITEAISALSQSYALAFTDLCAELKE